MQDSFLCVFRMFARTSTLLEAYGTVRMSEVGGQYGLNCTRLHRCTTLYILLLSALCLYFSFYHVFPFTSQKMAH
jgi:hypothetical protein